MAKFFTGFLTALIGSVVVNIIILYILKPFVINPAMPLHALSIGPVLGLTAIGAVGATIVYAIFRNYLQHPNTVFTWVAVIILLLSFIPDYMVIGMTTGPFAGGSWPSALTLALMHVAAAILIVYSLEKLWGPKQQTLAV